MTGQEHQGAHARLSLNTMTTRSWTLREAVDGAARAGIPAVGLWRDRVAEAGLERAAKLVRDAGLRVSSLCRGGFLTVMHVNAAGILARVGVSSSGRVRACRTPCGPGRGPVG